MMLAELKPYPKMKDSGVEWFGQVPAHWEVRRLRNTADIRVSSVDKHTKSEEEPTGGSGASSGRTPTPTAPTCPRASESASWARTTTGPASIWPSDRFFSSKRDEQIARHHRYHDTAYNLEPNVKGSPGGLRDIQMIGWVAKRHFGGETLSGLVDQGFLTEQELVRLIEGQAFLWRVRFALHILTGRREDRLLFDHQINIAGLLGYEDAATSLAVEQFMQRYYRTVMDLSRLNEMLLQSFEEAILLDPQARPQRIDAHFQVRNGYLEVTRNNVFNREPSALLKIFLLLQQKPELKGVSAGTIRLLRNNLDLVDEGVGFGVELFGGEPAAAVTVEHRDDALVVSDDRDVGEAVGVDIGDLEIPQGVCQK